MSLYYLHILYKRYADHCFSIACDSSWVIYSSRRYRHTVILYYNGKWFLMFYSLGDLTYNIQKCCNLKKILPRKLKSIGIHLAKYIPWKDDRITKDKVKIFSDWILECLPFIERLEVKDNTFTGHGNNIHHWPTRKHLAYGISFMRERRSYLQNVCS